MSQIHLTSISRYPLKGFAPQTLQRVSLQTGQGLPFDRAWGITNAERAIAPDGAWTACQAFVRMTKNLDLSLFDVQFDEQTLRLQLRAKNGQSLSVDLASEASVAQANERLAQWFPAKPTAMVNAQVQLMQATRSAGYWDHEDATLSIIHLPSVAQLSKLSGVEIDAARFRGNLLIDGGLPWQELLWPGHRVRIGDVELEILRPIDRCVATSVNLQTGERDINVPALLARHVGHIFCGVYARVIRSGEIQTVQPLQLLSKNKGILPRASKPSTAPPVAQWPRSAVVTDVIEESESVRSFWLKDCALDEGMAVPFTAGQHIRLHAVGQDSTSWRSYTVSAHANSAMRISVKREPRGGVSEWLHAHAKPGTEMLLSGPYGAFHLPPALQRPLIFLSAGIGITPLLAMFADWAQRPHDSQSRLVWIHSARHQAEIALWREAVRLAAPHAQAELRLHLSEAKSDMPNSKANADAIGFQAGQLDWKEVCALTAHLDADVYLCGPAGFMEAGLQQLQQSGVASSRIHFERFASPLSGAAVSRKPTHAGPFDVKFLRGGVQANMQVNWVESSGSLLDLADQHGLQLPANCRGGACGACEQTLVSGEVMHTTDVISGLAHRQILMCCAVPLCDLVIDA